MEEKQINASASNLNEIISEINSFSYDELVMIYEQLSQDSTVVFSEQFSVIRERRNFLENSEVSELVENAASFSIEQIDSTREKIAKKKYTKQSMVMIETALENRRVEIIVKILDEKIEPIEEMEREQVEELINEINDYKLPNNISINYMNKALSQLDACEIKELTEICADLEAKSISELESLLKLVRSQKFKPSNSNSFSSDIQDILDRRYIGELDVIIEGLDDADLGKAREIIKTVENYSCPINIKDAYRKTVNARINVLLKAQFDILVGDMEEKSMQELILLKTELAKTEYAQFGPEYFIHKADVLLGKYVYNEFDNILFGLEHANKRTCLNKREEIKALSLWSPAAKAALDIINKRILYLDLKELVTICNDVNSLNREDVVNMRAQIGNMDVSEQASNMFGALLKKREENIALKMVSPLSVKLSRILNAQQMKIPGMHISLEPDYLEAFSKFEKTFAISNIYEMPFFIIDSALMLSFSISSAYYKADGKLFKANIKNIRSFETVKSLLGDSLVINMKDGSKKTLAGTVNKKMSAMFVQILNEMVLSITDPERMRSFAPVNYTVENININKFESIDVYSVNYISCIRETANQLDSKKNELNLGRGLYHFFDEKFPAQIQKAKSLMGITTENRFAFMYDNTILGSGKEGFVIGARGIYAKQGNLSLVAIPIKEITGVRKNANRPALEIRTRTMGTFIIDKAIGDKVNYDILAEIILGHVTNMQVLALINEREGEELEKPIINATSVKVDTEVKEENTPAEKAINLGVVPNAKPADEIEAIDENVAEETEPLMEEIISEEAMEEEIIPEPMEEEIIVPEVAEEIVAPEAVEVPTEEVVVSEIGDDEVVVDEEQKEEPEEEAEEEIPELDLSVLSEPVEEEIPEINVEDMFETPTPMPDDAPNLFCTNCGSKILEGAKFCTKCGTKLI